MSKGPNHVRTVLDTYGRQLVSARRLARYRRGLRIAGAEDEVRLSREARRQAMVERISREIVENLVVTGSETPIVQEIQAALEQAVGARLIFEYPFLEQDLQIFEARDGGEPRRLSPEQSAEVLALLWRITVEKVDATML